MNKGLRILKLKEKGYTQVSCGQWEDFEVYWVHPKYLEEVNHNIEEWDQVYAEDAPPWAIIPEFDV